MRKKLVLTFILTCALLLATPQAWAAPKPLEPVAGVDCERRPNRPPPVPREEETIARLAPLRQCKGAIDDRTACNRFVGRALEVLFDNHDFKNAGDYMLANDIVSGLQQPGNLGWTKIGVATDQFVLEQAQRYANEGRPVVAGRLGLKKKDGSRGDGHVALVIPGTLQKVGFAGDYSWGGLQTPNSASFFIDRPDLIFAGCPLSAVWRRPNDVGLFVKSQKSF